VTIAAATVGGPVIAGLSTGLVEILQVADLKEIVHLIVDGLLELKDLVAVGASRGVVTEVVFELYSSLLPSETWSIVALFSF